MNTRKDTLFNILAKRPYVGLFMGAFGCNVVAALCEGVSYSLFLMALSRFCGVSVLPALSFSPQLLFIFAVLLQFLRSGAQFLGQWITTRVATRVQVEVQQAFFNQVLNWSFAHINSYRRGDLLDHARTPEKCIPRVLEAANRCLVSAMLIIVSLGVLCFISFPMTLALVVVFGGVVWFQKKVIGRVAHHSEKLAQESVQLSHETTQTLQGIRSLFSYHMQAQTRERLSEQLKEVGKVTRRLYGWNSILGPLQESIAILVVGGISILGFFLLEEPVLPSLFIFLALTYRMSSRSTILAFSLGEIVLDSGMLNRLKKILSSEHKEYAPTSGNQQARFEDELIFKNIGFSYPNSSESTLQGVHLTIKKGEMVAFVGHSGAGKSTLIDLILRLYNPTSGQIFVDKTPLDTFETGSWRRLIGVVHQEPFLFHDSIEANIRFGAADVTEEEMQNAARLAHIDALIERLPQGYQTVVGERGYRLSGGERQRIALARALVRNPEILILDEATSNLDSGYEAQIQQALEEIRQEKTLIVVAHRLSTVLHADCIYVILNGEIKEQGTHFHLLEQRGVYAKLWQLQTQTSLQHSIPGRH